MYGIFHFHLNYKTLLLKEKYVNITKKKKK